MGNARRALAAAMLRRPSVTSGQWWTLCLVPLGAGYMSLGSLQPVPPTTMIGSFGHATRPAWEWCATSDGDAARGVHSSAPVQPWSSGRMALQPMAGTRTSVNGPGPVDGGSSGDTVRRRHRVRRSGRRRTSAKIEGDGGAGSGTSCHVRR